MLALPPGRGSHWALLICPITLESTRLISMNASSVDDLLANTRPLSPNALVFPGQLRTSKDSDDNKPAPASQ